MNTPHPHGEPQRFESIVAFLALEPGDLPPAPLRAGYGRCSVSGCNCPSYMGNGELCGNCGHNYSLHW